MAETATKLGRVSLVPRGAYDAAATYNRLDIVGYEGSSYLVLADGTTGVTPAEGTSYMLVAEKGDTGATGETGETGATGPAGADGSDGADGVGIASIVRTGGDGSPGTTDTYTITMTDGATSTFTVHNGADGTSFTVLGRYDTLSELTAAHPTGSEGEAWAVGSAEDNVIYLWDVDAQAWRNIGSLQGPPGPAGQNGADGAPGAAGAPGEDGKSAYQYAVDGGYGGTEEEFQTLMGTGPWLPLSGGTMKGVLSPTTTITGGIQVLGAQFDADTDKTPPILDVRGVKPRYGSSYFGIKFYPTGIMSAIVGSTVDTLIVGAAIPKTDNGVANKKYVDDLVGDIGSILDEINGEVV